MTDSKRPESGLTDVELVRMLTVDAREHSSELLAAARAEANRRGLPIDERFLPDDSEEGDSAQAGGFSINGRTITCTQCSGTEFHTQRVLLNTRGMTLLKLDWLNQTATAVTCDRCGLVQLFRELPRDT